VGKFIVSISNKIQRYTVYLYLETALHVSGGTSTHHQERINNKYRRARPDDGRLVAEICRPNNMYVYLALKLFGAQ
jgi:hypothetical protein